MAEAPLTLAPGDFGLVIRADGTFDLLVPGGGEAKPLNSLQKALLGAAISVCSDEDTMDNFEMRYMLETTPVANKVAA